MQSTLLLFLNLHLVLLKRRPSHLLQPLYAVCPNLFPLLLNPILLLTSQQFLHILLVLLPFKVDLIVKLMLKCIFLFLKDLIVDLVLLEANLSLDDIDHFIHAFVLTHSFTVDLLAFLEDLLEFCLICILY